MNNKLKALKSMMGEPMIKIKIGGGSAMGDEEQAKGMVSMMVTPEEKEMILAQREGEDPEQNDEDQGEFSAKSGEEFQKSMMG